MSWRDVIGNMLESFDKPARPLGSAEDPFNFALQAAFTAPAATIPALQRAFPGLSPQEASTALKRAETLGRQALELYYAVRDGKLSEAAVEAQIKAAYPDISAANFSLLRARCHIATSK